MNTDYTSICCKIQIWEWKRVAENGGFKKISGQNSNQLTEKPFPRA